MSVSASESRSPAVATADAAARDVSSSRRWLIVAALGIAVVVACVASILFGSQRIGITEAMRGFLDGNGEAGTIVRELRVPRTVIAVFVGAALGIAGALIQGFTRNPLADPGILGVNAGANLAVVIGAGVFGITSAFVTIWFAFAGAIVATVVVYLIASIGRNRADPLRMTLSGVALGSVLGGVSAGIALLNPNAFDTARTWNAGSLHSLSPDVWVVMPFIVLGLLLAFALVPALNALALGDDLATALGSHIVATRITSIAAVTLLCGAATAAAGPIGFIGLMVPHAVRWFVGAHQGWIFAGTALAAPLLLLVSDIAGRVILPSGELQVGIVTAFIGAPVLIVLVQRRRVSGL